MPCQSIGTARAGTCHSGICLCLVTDNNRVNVKCFGKFDFNCNNNSLINPITKSDIYLLYDPVHIIKNVRNNWINKRKAEQPIEFYTTKDDGKAQKHCAKFFHLFKLYESVENSIIKIPLH